MQRVLVLGGNGFIGRHLLKHLTDEGSYQIQALARKEEAPIEGVSYIYSDFTDTEKFATAVEEADIIYHLISQSYPFTTWENPIAEVEQNLLPTLRMLECLNKEKKQRIIFVSSGGTVYGASAYNDVEKSIPAPYNPHGIIKLCIEHFLRYIQHRRQHEYIVHRISNVYGPGQNTNKGLGFINTVVEKALADEAIPVMGDGNQARDFVFIDDVVNVLALSAIHPKVNCTYNLSSGECHSLNELLQIIETQLGKSLTRSALAARPFDFPKIEIDNTRLMSDFKELHFTRIEDGIRRTIEALNA